MKENTIRREKMNKNNKNNNRLKEESSCNYFFEIYQIYISSTLTDKVLSTICQVDSLIRRVFCFM